jgi:lipopolysaccharide exporter
LRFVRNVILARLLAPSEFGLMALVMVSAAVIEALTEVGVKQSIIQHKRGGQSEYLNAAWFIQAGRGLVLFILTYIATPLISQFYSRPELTSLLRFGAISILLNGLISPGTYVLEKEFRFSKVAFLTQGSAVCGILTTLGLSIIVKNVWALVIGMVTETAVRCLLSFVLCPFVPKPRMNTSDFGELTKFARGMFGLPILTLIAVRMDILVIGKVMTTELLGMYAMALELAQIPFEFFSRVVNPVLLPAMAEKQNDIPALRRAILKITMATSAVSIPLTGFLCVCAKPVLAIAYGSQYAAVSVTFAILSLYIYIRIQGTILGQVVFAIGQPHLQRLFTIVRLVILLILIFPATHYLGISGAAASLVLASGIALVLQMVRVGNLVNLHIRDYLRAIIPAINSTMVIVLPISIIGVLWTRSLYGRVLIGFVAFILGCAAGIMWYRRTSLSEQKEGFKTASKPRKADVTA